MRDVLSYDSAETQKLSPFFHAAETAIGLRPERTG